MKRRPNNHKHKHRIDKEGSANRPRKLRTEQDEKRSRKYGPLLIDDEDENQEQEN